MQSVFQNAKGVIYVNCNISAEVFNITGFKYKTDYSGYDAILDGGDYKKLSTCTLILTNDYKLKEDASGSAFYQYDITFYPMDYAAFVPASCRVVLSVGNNSFDVTVTG